MLGVRVRVKVQLVAITNSWQMRLCFMPIKHAVEDAAMGWWEG